MENARWEAQRPTVNQDSRHEAYPHITLSEGSTAPRIFPSRPSTERQLALRWDDHLLRRRQRNAPWTETLFAHVVLEHVERAERRQFPGRPNRNPPTQTSTQYDALTTLMCRNDSLNRIRDF